MRVQTHTLKHTHTHALSHSLTLSLSLSRSLSLSLSHTHTHALFLSISLSLSLSLSLSHLAQVINVEVRRLVLSSTKGLTSASILKNSPSHLSKILKTQDL